MATPKVHLQIIALADQVISAEDGKKSIIGIFDKIFVQQLPATHPRMTLFLSLHGESKTQEKVELQFEGPGGKSLDSKTLEFEFGDNGKANLIINLEGFPVQETGGHEIEVLHKGKLLGSTHFDVIQVQNNQGKVVH